MIRDGAYVSWLQEVGDAFHRTPDPERQFFVILRYYVDVSGKETTPGERAITAAGYIANKTQWGRFERVWENTLALSNLSYFHATEFFAFAGDFAKLKEDPEAHRRIAGLLALTAYTMIPYGFSSTLDLQPYDPIITEACRKLKTPNNRLRPEMVAVSMAANHVAQRCLPPGGPQAEMLIEEGDGVGEVIDYLWWLKRVGEPWTGAFVGFAPISGDEYPVQAADYLAHESWQEAKAFLTSPTPRTWKDITREQFKLLATGPEMLAPEVANAKIEVRYASENEMRSSAPHMAQWIAEHPIYQKPPWIRRWRRNTRLWLRARWRELVRSVRGGIKRLWYGRIKKRWR